MICYPLKPVALATALFLSGLAASPASALTCGNVIFDVTGSTQSACDGPHGHNATMTLFGETFTLGQHSEDNGTVTGGDGKVFFSNFIKDSDDGKWSIGTTLSNVIEVVIGIKQARYHGHFLLDLAGGFPLSGEWSVKGPGRSIGDLSHAEIWYRTGTPSPSTPPSASEVPLPAALPLLGSALLGAGALGLRRRRKAA